MDAPKAISPWPRPFMARRIVVVDRIRCSPIREPDQHDQGDWSAGHSIQAVSAATGWGRGTRFRTTASSWRSHLLPRILLRRRIRHGILRGGLPAASVTIDTQKLLGLKDGVFFINYQNWGWYNDIFQNTDSFDPASTAPHRTANSPMPPRSIRFHSCTIRSISSMTC